MNELFDDIDRNILKLLQENTNHSLEGIAEQVGVSLNTCWRRVQKLEETGVLKRRVALLDNDKVGLPLTVIVSIRTDEHSQSWSEQFSKAVRDIPEIVEIYRMAGDVDYLMKLVVRNVAHYDRVYQRLISKVSLSDVSASFAMERMKHTTALPI